MKQLHYTVTSFASRWTAKYFDTERGESFNTPRSYGDPAEASQEFKAQNPGAVYLTPDTFRGLVNKAAREREMLTEWNSNAPATPAQPRPRTAPKAAIVQETLF
jgi:hypothetical protein